MARPWSCQHHHRHQKEEESKPSTKKIRTCDNVLELSMQASPFSSASPPAAKKMIEYIDMSISQNIFVSPSPPAAHHIDDRMIDYIYMNILLIHWYQPDIVDFATYAFNNTLEIGPRQIQKQKHKYLCLCQLSMWSDAGKVEDLPQSNAKGPHVRFCCVPTLKIWSSANMLINIFTVCQ